MKSIISSISHAALVVILQLLFLIICGYLFPSMSIVMSCSLGSLFGVGFYFGREITQHERKVGIPPWYNGFKIWEWSLDSKLDLLFPLIVGILMPIILYFTL